MNGPCLAWIALGASLGDREATLRSAASALMQVPGVLALRISPVYETRPTGAASQAFLNAVAQARVELEPLALLQTLLAIERAHGRVRTVPGSDRTLDLDLLYAVDARGDARPGAPPELELPHPRLRARDFVLRPWLDLCPDQTLADGSPLAHALASLPDAARTILRRVPVDFEPKILVP